MSDQNAASRYHFTVYPEEGQNFWDANPGLLNLDPYPQFKKKQGTRRSSNLMKAIWQVYDPKAKGVIADRPVKDLQNDIATNFLNDPKFNWKDKDIRNVIEAYKQDCMTFMEKELKYWEMELRERRLYMAELPWDMEREEKDKMLSTQPKLWDEYMRYKKEVDKERQERFHGGGTLSFLEKQSRK